MTTEGANLPLDKLVPAAVAAGYEAAGFRPLRGSEFVSIPPFVADGIQCVCSFTCNDKYLPDFYSISPIFGVICQPLERTYSALFGLERARRRSLTTNAGNILNGSYMSWEYTMGQAFPAAITEVTILLCEVGLREYWSKRATAEQCAEAVVVNDIDSHIPRRDLLVPSLVMLGHSDEAKRILIEDRRRASNDDRKAILDYALARIDGISTA